MTEREFTVTTTDTAMTFREQWLHGTASTGTEYELDIGVSSPTVTLNVRHGDRTVRESIDLTAMVTDWVKQISKDMKKEEVHYGDD